VTVGGPSSVHQGRRTARSTAVIVLKPVGGGVQPGAGAGLVRRSVGDSTMTVDDDAGQARVKSSGGSTVSVELHHGRTAAAESTTMDMDVMSTSRASDDDWAAAFGACAAAPATSADPWSAIEHRHDTTSLTTTAVVDEKAQTEVDWSATAATGGSWWTADAAASGTTPTRMSDVFSASLSVFRHHQTTLQGATGVRDDTERLIDDATDRPIL